MADENELMATTGQWHPEPTAPIDTDVLVFTTDGGPIAVGVKKLTWKGAPWWMVADSFGFNEDGEIRGVTHWMPLPEPPR